MRKILNWIKKTVTFQNVSCANIAVGGTSAFTGNSSFAGVSTFNNNVQMNGTLDVDDILSCESDIYGNSRIFFTDLPSSDPTEEGQLWSNSGVLTVSSG